MADKKGVELNFSKEQALVKVTAYDVDYLNSQLGSWITDTGKSYFISIEDSNILKISNDKTTIHSNPDIQFECSDKQLEMILAPPTDTSYTGVITCHLDILS